MVDLRQPTRSRTLVLTLGTASKTIGTTETTVIVPTVCWVRPGSRSEITLPLFVAKSLRSSVENRSEMDEPIVTVLVLRVTNSWLVSVTAVVIDRLDQNACIHMVPFWVTQQIF